MAGPWYESLFDERYLDAYPILRRATVAEDEARQLATLLDLRAGSSVLDLGCGTGRHAVALAGQGHRVVGLDLSQQLLEQARRTADSLGLEVTWLHRDMRDLQDLGPFDAVLSLYTAFGFLGDEEDQEVIDQATAALAPSGKLLVHLTNFLGYLSRFPPICWHEHEQVIVREENAYDAARGVLSTRRTLFRKQGGQDELPMSEVRAYLPHEVLAMLRRADLSLLGVYGGLDGSAADWQRSSDLVFVAEKPV